MRPTPARGQSIRSAHRAAGSTAMIGVGRLGALFRHAQCELEAGRDVALRRVQALLRADLAEIGATGPRERRRVATLDRWKIK